MHARSQKRTLSSLRSYLLATPVVLSIWFAPEGFAQSNDNPEVKRHASLLAVSSDPKIVRQVLFVDLSQRLAYLLKEDGEISRSYAIQAGQVTFAGKEKTDLRPPTGVFYLRQDKKSGKLVFESLPFDFKKNKTKEFSAISSAQKIDDYKCTTPHCLAFSENDLKDLSSLAETRPILALLNRRGEWLSEDVHQEQKKRIQTWFNKWKSTWESRDLDSYQKFYAQDFSDLFFKNRAAWMDRKSNIFKKYTNIQLEMGPMTLIHFEDYYLAQFTQVFRSNEYTDHGIKTLIFRSLDDDQLEIVFEDWFEVKN